MWLRYSPWGDPGALTIGVRLAVAGILLLVLPVSLIVAWVLREVRREIRRSGLSPFQVAVIETVGLEALHHEMHKRNQATSARLTASVMGPERTELWPGA